jgi:hypothetical protein
MPSTIRTSSKTRNPCEKKISRISKNPTNWIVAMLVVTSKRFLLRLLVARSEWVRMESGLALDLLQMECHGRTVIDAAGHRKTGDRRALVFLQARLTVDTTDVDLTTIGLLLLLRASPTGEAQQIMAGITLYPTMAIVIAPCRLPRVKVVIHCLRLRPVRISTEVQVRTVAKIGLVIATQAMYISPTTIVVTVRR